MKVKLRGSCLILTLLLACSALAFTGCEYTEVIDPTKTQLYIGNYNGGMGQDWLQEVKNAFEAVHPDVQVIIRNKKDEYMGQTLLATIDLNQEDLYFTTEVSYDDAVAKDKFLDITDVVTTPYDAGEGDGTEASIEERMPEHIARYFKRNGKYYAIPFFTAVYGIVYDRDLFESRNLYALEGYSGAFGPDGIEGTYDDGLPATWEDFKLLMRVMKESNITPFTFSGMHHYYRLAFLRALWASYEGLDDFMLNYTFDGTETQADIGRITSANGYLLQKQMGKRASIQAAWDIMSDAKFYTPRSISTSQTNIGTQEEFLLSSAIQQPVAMMMEGGWWENEARGMFNDMQEKYGDEYAYGERNFGYMPFPRFVGTEGIDDQPDHKTTLYSDGNTMVFINKTSKNTELAKEFLRFSTSNRSLATCTRVTGVIRPYKYELSEEDLAAMTPYGRSIWEIYNSENTDLVASYNISKLRQASPGFFKEKWEYSVTVENKPYIEPFIPFYNKKDNKLTVDKYCSGFTANYSKEKWDAEFKDTFYPDAA